MKQKDIRILALLSAGRYIVSEEGEVISTRYFGNEGRTGPIQPHFNKRGYGYVMLYDLDGKQTNVRLNRLVALAHLPNPFDLPEVNHEDGDKSNNRKTNLLWCSRSYNEQHARASGLKSGMSGESNPHSKLTAGQVDEIRSIALAGLVSQRKIAIQFGISQSVVSQIKTNQAWSAA